MMRLAERCAKDYKCGAIITGESLGQVASQTLAAIGVTDSAVSIPVFRPCIGLDKSEIVSEARKYGTFETSILPYEDCCTVFTPRHPKTQPRIEDVMRELEKMVLLRNVDNRWMDHIDAMADLRQGIGLRAIANHDPVVEYRNVGFDMFDEMVAGIRELTVRTLMHTTVNVAPVQREQVAKPIEPGAAAGRQPKRSDKKAGPNDPCPCGSGKKYKKCCGRPTA